MASSTIASQPGQPGAGGTIGPAPLSITSFSPDHGEVGTMVTIYGSGFEAETGVQFSFDVDAQVSFASGGEIVTAVPKGATTGPITVFTATSQASTATPFKVDPPQIEVSVNPTSGRPGDMLKFTGRHLETVTSVVLQAVNGSFPLTPVAIMPKSFKAVVPQGPAPGPARIVLMSTLGKTAVDFKVKRSAG